MIIKNRMVSKVKADFLGIMWFWLVLFCCFAWVRVGFNCAVDSKTVNTASMVVSAARLDCDQYNGFRGDCIILKKNATKVIVSDRFSNLLNDKQFDVKNFGDMLSLGDQQLSVLDKNSDVVSAVGAGVFKVDTNGSHKANSTLITKYDIVTTMGMLPILPLLFLVFSVFKLRRELKRVASDEDGISINSEND